MDQLFTTPYIYYMGAFITLGYGVMVGMIYMLPRRLAAENNDQKVEVINQAKRQREKIIGENQRRLEHKDEIKLEELESEIEERMMNLKESEEELDILAETVAQAEQRLLKQSQDHTQKCSKLENLRSKFQEVREEFAQRNEAYYNELIAVNSDINANNKLKELSENLVGQRQLSVQKSIKDLQEELDTHATRLATRVLDRISSRYAPQFVWPKSSYHVPITDERIAEQLSASGNNIISELAELTEDVTISLTTDKEDAPLGVKLVGGYGIYKEAAKLTLDQLLNRGEREWSKVHATYQEHREKLEHEAYCLGKHAVTELGLEGIHDEILKMVGALNWRTSYRQNQFLHSLEVATIAGIVATEIGVDPDQAKRCGLLHDIGKGIDYRIDGSHAVISGDYADRFGENRLICDTVMSHHNDLVLETPLSYVLKTADTLSGARPGARVNIEEGYQIRLSAIDQAVRSFKGVEKIAIMSGGREVHVEVTPTKVKEHELQRLTSDIAKKIQDEVAFPGQIKVLVTRRFEATAVA